MFVYSVSHSYSLFFILSNISSPNLVEGKRGQILCPGMPRGLRVYKNPCRGLTSILFGSCTSLELTFHRGGATQVLWLSAEPWLHLKSPSNNQLPKPWQLNPLLIGAKLSGRLKASRNKDTSTFSESVSDTCFSLAVPLLVE